jgi:hypothetical protein
VQNQGVSLGFRQGIELCDDLSPKVETVGLCSGRLELQLARIRRGFQAPRRCFARGEHAADDDPVRPGAERAVPTITGEPLQDREQCFLAEVIDVEVSAYEITDEVSYTWQKVDDELPQRRRMTTCGLQGQLRPLLIVSVSIFHAPEESNNLSVSINGQSIEACRSGQTDPTRTITPHPRVKLRPVSRHEGFVHS